MRTYGKDSPNGEQQNMDTQQMPPWTPGQGPPVGFQHFMHFGYPGMMPPPYHYGQEVPVSQEEEAQNSDSADNQGASPAKPAAAPTKLPPFAKKWFELDQPKKKEFRETREKWIASQKECGKNNPEKDIQGRKTVIPQFAAKWLALSEEEKQQYRAFKHQMPNGGAALPPFAKKWFDLDQSQKKEIREKRAKWIASQNALGKQNPEKDIQGLKTVIPQFAAKWLALSEEEKQQYRAFKNQKPTAADIPPFALKWFELPEKKKKEFRQMKVKATKEKKEAWSSDDKSGPEVSDLEDAGMPPFAAKWLALPEDKKNAMRIKYRHGKKCAKGDCEGLKHMLAMLQWRQAQGPQGPQPTMPPHMMMPPHGPHQHRGPHGPHGPWMMRPGMGPMGPHMGKHHPHPAMFAPPPHMYGPCPMQMPPFAMMKKMQRMQRMAAQKASAEETGNATKSSSDSSNSEDEAVDTAPPPFVKKWFALPMEARQQLRMIKQGGSEEALPPFAKKWFALPEKKKQHWRKLHRGQKQQKKDDRKQAETTEFLPVDDRDVTVRFAASDEEGACAESAPLPEFARKWFALPVAQKHHLRMLNKYLSTPKDSSSSSETTSDEERYSETMPDFAAKWFSLSSEERQRLRNMKRNNNKKGADSKQGKCGGRGRRQQGGRWGQPWGQAGAQPWQQWAYYMTPPQQMGNPFGGPKQQGYQKMHVEKPKCDSDY